MKKWTTILVIAIIVIGLSTGGVFAAREFYFKEEKEKVVKAEKGDTVEIHYVGRLRDDRLYEGMRIFDTSYEDIPEVNEPKYTLTYNHERERGEPFEFTLGESVIEGWNENVKGMEEGESKWFQVPQNKGYGKASEDLRFQIERTETLPVYEEMDKQEFTDSFTKPSINMVVEDQFWGWDKIVTSVGKDTVKLRNEPDLEEVYRPTGGKGWEVKVKSIDSTAANGTGEIKIEHTVHKPVVVNTELLSLYDEKFRNIPQVKGRLGQSSDGEGILIPNEDHITVDFNDEVNGKTLYFEVEVVNIEKN